MTDFAPRLLAWFDEYGRKDLPWQRDINPYRVWVSEIMLQQTQVATVIPYYERFMQRFPGIDALAAASDDEVMQHWSGLGYYARARNLHAAAKQVRDDFAGRFPTAFDDVVALPGIGRSTAGAILAIACGERHAILDGNVKRVLARYHAIEGWPSKTAVANELWAEADKHTPERRVADYTQAIMDLGATLCTRSKPRCVDCPFQADCTAHARGEETAYPGRKPKRAKPVRSTCMLIVRRGDRLLLEKRPPAGIWGGLWSLPEAESVAAASDWCSDRLGAPASRIETWPTLRHSFSHYDLDIQPLLVRPGDASRTVADPANTDWFEIGRVTGVGLAAPVKTLIERLHTEES